MERTNTDRAVRALRGVESYVTGSSGEGKPPNLGENFEVDRRLRKLADQDVMHEALGDALCDLMHLADRVGVEWSAVLLRADNHYSAETEECDPGDWPVYIERS